MVHRRSLSLDGFGTQQDDQVDMVPVCQMVSCVTRNGPHTFSDASGTETAAVDGPDTFSDASGTETAAVDGLDTFSDASGTETAAVNGLDTFSDASGTETTAVDGQDMDDFYQGIVSSDEEDFVVFDVGSITDVSLNSEEEELINSDVESVVDFDSDNSKIFVVIQIMDL